MWRVAILAPLNVSQFKVSDLPGRESHRLCNGPGSSQHAFQNQSRAQLEGARPCEHDMPSVAQFVQRHETLRNATRPSLHANRRPALRETAVICQHSPSPLLCRPYCIVIAEQRTPACRPFHSSGRYREPCRLCHMGSRHVAPVKRSRNIHAMPPVAHHSSSSSSSCLFLNSMRATLFCTFCSRPCHSVQQRAAPRNCTCLTRCTRRPFFFLSSEICSACCRWRSSASAMRGRSLARLVKPSVEGICWSSNAFSCDAVVANWGARSTTTTAFSSVSRPASSVSCSGFRRSLCLVTAGY